MNIADLLPELTVPEERSAPKEDAFPDQAMPGDLITPREAAVLLRVHQSTIYRAFLDGRLQCWQRWGRRRFVSRSAVLAVFSIQPVRTPQRVPERPEEFRARLARELRERGLMEGKA